MAMTIMADNHPSNRNLDSRRSFKMRAVH